MPKRFSFFPVQKEVTLDPSSNYNPTAVAETRGYAEAKVREFTPVDTGLLRSNWTVYNKRDVLTLDNFTPYAGFVENGTRKMKARPMASATIPLAREYYWERVGYYMSIK